jgi:hypothetical protein
MKAARCAPIAISRYMDMDGLTGVDEVANIALGGYSSEKNGVMDVQCEIISADRAVKGNVFRLLYITT